MDSCRLTVRARACGCGGKLGPDDLQGLLAGLRFPTDPRLITGLASGEDAGVFLLDHERGIILTVDFFSPVVDDPYCFGAIAAANSLSDIYAVGGTPLAALNLCAFPVLEDPEPLRGILQGGADKVAQAGAVIAGGHTVRNDDLKYGLAVMGFARPDRLLGNHGARPGDRLVLTKPLGVGLLTTAAKHDAITAAELAPAVDSMLALNRRASEAMLEVGAHGATDVTGFGLLGHACEMARASGVDLKIDLDAVPLLPGAAACADSGHAPSITAANLAHFGPRVKGEPPAPWWWPVLFDPQTSGGLLISLPAHRVSDLLTKLDGPPGSARMIGEVKNRGEGSVHLG